MIAINTNNLLFSTVLLAPEVALVNQSEPNADKLLKMAIGVVDASEKSSNPDRALGQLTKYADRFKAAGKKIPPQVKRRVFLTANRIFLRQTGDPSLNQKVAQILISAVHRKVSEDGLRTMRDNHKFALAILTGIPYDHGYVDLDGKIKCGPRAERLGLNCLTMNNILANLTIGAGGYTLDVRTTNEGIFRKREFSEMGVLTVPVIEHFPGGRYAELSRLMNNYGDFFTLQTYGPNNVALHALFVYKKDGGYHVLDVLARGGFNDVGTLEKYVSDRILANYTVNLLDTEDAKSVQQSRPGAFLHTLQSSRMKLTAEKIECGR